MTLHQEAGILLVTAAGTAQTFRFLELGLSSPASPVYNRACSSAVRESSQYAPNLPHACSLLLVCVGLLCTASGFIFDYLHPEYVSSFPSYLYLLRAVPLLIAAGVVETVFRLLEEEIKAEGMQAISRTAHEAWPRLQRYPFEFTQSLGDFLICPYNSTPCSHRAQPRTHRCATGRSQAHETLKTMTTVIMRTSDDNRMWLFRALFQGFPILGNLPISLVFHEAPTGTQA